MTGEAPAGAAAVFWLGCSVVPAAPATAPASGSLGVLLLLGAGVAATKVTSAALAAAAGGAADEPDLPPGC